jgi:hypothetical protein
MEGRPMYPTLWLAAALLAPGPVESALPPPSPPAEVVTSLTAYGSHRPGDRGDRGR